MHYNFISFNLHIYIILFTCLLLYEGESVSIIEFNSYLKPQYPFEDNFFGGTVAAHSGIIVICANGDSSGAIGVDGIVENKTSIFFGGACYVFEKEKNSGKWEQTSYLKAEQPGNFDQFGSSVSIYKDTIIVGSPGEDSGIEGNQTDNSASVSGAVYIFRKNIGLGGKWIQEDYLKSNPIIEFSFFGSKVCIGSNFAAVSTIGNFSSEGSVLTFEMKSSGGGGGGGGKWEQNEIIAPLINGKVDSLVAFENYLLIGSGDEKVEEREFAGMVYLYLLSGSTWKLQHIFKAVLPLPNNLFGGSLDMTQDSSGMIFPIGVPGHSNSKGEISVYIERDEQYLLSEPSFSRALIDQKIGFSLAMSGNTLIVGVPGDGFNSSGIFEGTPGGTPINEAKDSGAAYLQILENTWIQVAYIKPPNTGVGDEFGKRVAITGSTIVICAPNEDSFSSSNMTDNSLSNNGACFIYNCNDCPTFSDEDEGNIKNNGKQINSSFYNVISLILYLF